MKEESKNRNLLNSSSVRSNNRVRVLNYLHQAGGATQTEIRDALHLSGPTVIQTLQEFREMGLVGEGESLPSQGGRKPRTSVFQYDAWHSVGVEIRRRHVDIRVLNLKGELAAGRTFRLPYAGDTGYWRQVERLIGEVLRERENQSPVLGTAIGFPGEISPDRERILRATVLGIEEIPVSRIREAFSGLVQVEYGANAGAFGLVWRTGLQDAVYVIITDNGVAGAIIIDRKIYRGKNGRPAAFGHVPLNPDGIPCSCGSRGCWAAYGSLTYLTGSEEPDLKGFFRRLEEGDPICAGRWEQYLSYLAQGLASVHLAYDLDVIVAGKLTPYLEKWVNRLEEKIRAYPVLKKEPPFIRLNTVTDNPIAEGAALMLIDSFLNDSLDQMGFEEILARGQK